MEMHQLEERIRYLCTRLRATNDDTELTSLLTELRFALREHTDTVRRLAYDTLHGLNGMDQKDADQLPLPSSKAD